MVTIGCKDWKWKSDIRFISYMIHVHTSIHESRKNGAKRSVWIFPPYPWNMYCFDMEFLNFAKFSQSHACCTDNLCRVTHFSIDLCNGSVICQETHNIINKSSILGSFIIFQIFYSYFLLYRKEALKTCCENLNFYNYFMKVLALCIRFFTLLQLLLHCT